MDIKQTPTNLYMYRYLFFINTMAHILLTNILPIPTYKDDFSKPSSSKGYKIGSLSLSLKCNLFSPQKISISIALLYFLIDFQPIFLVSQLSLPCMDLDGITRWNWECNSLLHNWFSFTYTIPNWFRRKISIRRKWRVLEAHGQF